MNANFERLTASEMDPLRGGIFGKKYDQNTKSSQGSTKSNGAYDTDQNGDSDPSSSMVEDFDNNEVVSSTEAMVNDNDTVVEIGTDIAISTPLL